MATETYLISRTEILELGALMLLPVLGVTRLGVEAGAILSVVMLAATSAAYFVITVDKRLAKKRKPRIPEFPLHVLELLGGWPGSYIAQRRHGHKIMKRRYQTIFWLIVVAHQALFLRSLTR